MDLLGQSALWVGVTSFALGFATLARNVRNKLYITYAVVCTLVSGWAIAFVLERIWSDLGFYRIHLFFNFWLGPAALIFIRVMARMHDGFSRRMLDLSVIVAIALSLALALRMETLPWMLQLMYFSPAFLVIQILQLMYNEVRLNLGLKRRLNAPTVGLARRNWIYIGALVLLMTSVMDHVPFLGNVVPALGNLGLTVYLFFVSQAISQQRLLNFGALFSKFLVLIAVALTLTGVYSILVAWIEGSPGLFFLNSFIASFVILMLLDPLRSLVRYFTQTLLTQKQRQLEQALREAQLRLAGIVDPIALAQEVLMTVEQTLQPEWAALFVLERDGTRYRRVRVVGVEPDRGENAPIDVHGRAAQPLREILAGHPLLLQCDRRRKRSELPVLLDQMLENEIERSASRPQREALAGLVQGLRALGGTLLLPLYDSGQILGFVVVYSAKPPEAWGSNWGILQILYPYFEQAGITLRNMEVYVRSRDKERLATLGEMAAGLAHEIRNPLGAIKGAAQFLDPGPERPDSQFLRIIVEETDRLNRVVTQFLDYSKPNTADRSRIDLSVVAEKTIELLRADVPDGMRLDFNPAPEPAWVMAAPEQIKQVLLNLAQNSFRALEGSPRGPGAGNDQAQVLLSVQVRGQGDDARVHVIVEDNGPGIVRGNLEKLFIPFFTTRPSGTGLGLSISQKIMEAHGGQIEVASEEGRFARFSVIMPYAGGP